MEKIFNIEVLSDAMLDVMLLNAKLEESLIMSIDKRMPIENEISKAKERVNHIRTGMGVKIY